MVVPVILSSDKTVLSVFSRDKKAWPVYLTIVLIGYLPVSKLDCFQKKSRSDAGHGLFHFAMSSLLCSLVDAGCQGKPMVCTDGFVCRVHPILAAYVANFPEQCLVACNKESRCPCCLVESQDRGELEECAQRSMVDTLRTLQRKKINKQSQKFNIEGLRPVYEPFWKDLPFTNIFVCITPDIIHQLHKGIFHDHLVQWCLGIVGKKEMDKCFQGMS